MRARVSFFAPPPSEVDWNKIAFDRHVYHYMTIDDVGYWVSEDIPRNFTAVWNELIDFYDNEEAYHSG